MPEINQVVVHGLDGSLVKGTTQDFSPGRSSFHVIPAAGGPAVEVDSRRIKAVFFVRQLEGEPGRVRPRGFPEAGGVRCQGKKIAVLFKDGELLCGTTLAYTSGRQGFFVIPADAGGNNQRIYINEGATIEVRVGPSAELFAREVLGAHAPAGAV